MGYEIKCKVRVADGTGSVRESDAATVLLETDELIVRGPSRVRVPRASITDVAARGGVVTIKSPTATIALTLGAEAALKWRKKLEEAPKSLIDKLDVKPDARVWLWHVADGPLIAQVRARAAEVSTGRAASARDVVFVQVDSVHDLDRIDRAAKAIVDDGAIWVVHPKGKNGVADTAIFARAKALGLTYTKVARISETLSAEKLVRPRAARGGRS
jgi:hypothetical protein